MCSLKSPMSQVLSNTSTSFSSQKCMGALCYRSPCPPCSTSYACVHVTDLKQEVKMVRYLIGEILSKLCFID